MAAKHLRVFFRPAPHSGQGSYVVSLGEDGPETAIGVVKKKIEHYNLIRPITVTSWLVRSASGPDELVAFRERSFSTRREATSALVRAYFRDRKWEDVPPVPGGHEGVWKCLSDLCGAYVRETIPGSMTYYRDKHDDAFHADEVTL